MDQKHALYDLYYGSMEQELQRTRERHSKHLDPSVHARHCFDYLRQSLMCQADTNLEPYDYHLDGVTGWVQRNCRDYDAVVTFANAWGGSKYANKQDK